MAINSLARNFLKSLPSFLTHPSRPDKRLRSELRNRSHKPTAAGTEVHAFLAQKILGSLEVSGPCAVPTHVQTSHLHPLLALEGQNW